MTRDLAENLPVMCWKADASGSIYWYNQGWYEYTGTTPEAMAGWGWQSVHHPDVLPDVLDRWRACIATGAPFQMIFPLRGRDRVFRPFLTRVRPVDEDGQRVWIGMNVSLDGLEDGALAQEWRAFRARLGA